jgi:hypothetical protein
MRFAFKIHKGKMNYYCKYYYTVDSDSITFPISVKIATRYALRKCKMQNNKIEVLDFVMGYESSLRTRRISVSSLNISKVTAHERIQHL